MRRSLIAFALMTAFMMVGCGEDAAKDVPKVTAGAPKAVPSDTPTAPTTATETKDAAATATTTAAPAVAGSLVIAPATSKIEFIGSKKVGGSHNGGFKEFSGTADLVAGKPEIKGIAVEIDTKSIFADDPKLVEHLKNADFFDVTKFPTAKFVTTEIKAGGEKGATHTLVGNLSLHGVTKSISIPATVKVDGDSFTLKSEFALNKNDFGMTFGGTPNVIREEVVIKLDVKAAKKG